MSAQAQRIDNEEDALYGKGKDAHEIPDELKRKRTRARKAEDEADRLAAEGDEPTQSEKEAWRKMREKLGTAHGSEVYARRKAIVEPVFGHAKEARSFRRFSLRGLDKVRAEWTLVCLCSNLLKLVRYSSVEQLVTVS